MAKVLRKRAKTKKSTREELELLDKSELIDKILKLEAHNEQLKVLITKAADCRSEKKATVEKARKAFDFSR